MTTGPPVPLRDVLGPPASALDFADSLLCGLVRCAPCRLHAELVAPASDREVVFRLSDPEDTGRADEVARCRASAFRAVLARISTVLGIEPYLGAVEREVELDGRVVSVVGVVSNQGRGGFWLRLWASIPAASVDAPQPAGRSTHPTCFVSSTGEAS